MYKNNSLSVTLLFLFILLSISIVYGDGVCTLNKNEYNPGENSIFNCVCTLPIEENQDGYFVWRDSTGDVLHSVSMNSGNCITNSFSNNYIFNYQSNYSGNVTFSLNENGTGTPINWGGVRDVNYDTFNVTGPSIVDCIITPNYYVNITNKNERVNLGEERVLEFIVIDALTNYTLTHVQCEVILFDSRYNYPIFQEPFKTYNEHHVETGAYGLGYITHKFDDKLLKPNSTYYYEVNCYCLNNTDESCYYGDGGLGAVAGFKECTTDSLFTTGDDLRLKDSTTTESYDKQNFNSLIGIILMIIILLFSSWLLTSKFEILRYILLTLSFCLGILAFVMTINPLYASVSTFILYLILILLFVTVSSYIIYFQIKRINSKKIKNPIDRFRKR